MVIRTGSSSANQYSPISSKYLKTLLDAWAININVAGTASTQVTALNATGTGNINTQITNAEPTG